MTHLLQMTHDIIASAQSNPRAQLEKLNTHLAFMKLLCMGYTDEEVVPREEAMVS